MKPLVWIIDVDADTWGGDIQEQAEERGLEVEIVLFGYPMDAHRASGSPLAIMFDGGTMGIHGVSADTYVSVARLFRESHPGAWLFVVSAMGRAWTRTVFEEIDGALDDPLLRLREKEEVPDEVLQLLADPSYAPTPATGP